MIALTVKERWEQKVFVAFSRCCGLKINETSIESRTPPMPDIYCNIEGVDYLFELAEVVPEVQAQALNTKGVYSYGFPDTHKLGPRAMANILRQKQHKHYETGGLPVDLLLYFSTDFPIYLPDVKSESAGLTDIDVAIQDCKRVGQFKRIWTYCSLADKAKLLN